MADLSNTSEYAKYQHLEKVYLGDSVTALDYKHNISAVERIVSITYDCIKKVNAVVEIGVASSSLSDILKTDAGGSVAGGFDTSVIESTLTSHTNELARLDSAKQDKLTAGENIEIINNVISATGGGHGDCTCHYGVGAPAESLGINGDIYVEMSPDPSGCEDSITYNRSSNLSSITNSYSDGFHKIEGSWWTDRYEHSYTTYRIDGLTAGKTYDVILKVKVKNLVQEYQSSSELFGIAIQNGGFFTTLSEHVKNGEFAYYEDGSDKIYFQSLKPMTTKVQSYSFKFTAFANTYILISPDSIVDDSTIPMDIEIAISDGTVGNYVEDVYYKVEGEWLLYDNDTKYVAGDNITITEVDGENVISATDTDAIEDLTDVELDNLSDGQILKYNSTSQKWENGNESGGGGGSDVEANPSDPATDTLYTIGIDGTVYNIAGGGGGGSSSYTETTLWENASGEAFKPNDSKTVTLSDSLSNYDAISFVFGGSTSAGNKATFLVLVSDLMNYSSEGILAICTHGSLNYQPITNYVDNTHITFSGWTSSENCYAYKVTGVKFGGGSQENYSTDEQVIGTWIDGKPLYRRTFNNLSISLSGNSWTSTGITIPNAKPIKIDGISGSGNLDTIVLSASIESNGELSVFNVRSATTTCATLTIQYTKTTDV
jgi:hypothetical protein